MPVTSVSKDSAAATMTITSQFDAPLERVWQLWENPRLLERWWGPPTYPATFVEHDLTPNGRATYFMTGPTGDKPQGWWRIIAVDAPLRLEFEDGFADDTGEPNADLPTTRVVVTLSELPDGGTRMVIHSAFPSTEALEQLLAMGMEEGLAAALGQIDGLLAAAH